MKILKPLFLVFALVFVLSGCSGFRIASSIDDLISPISPIGDDAGAQNALDEFCKGGYSSKIPTSGKYSTSFVFSDLDGDDVDEAVAFYEASNSSGTMSMAVIKKTSDKWSVVDNISAAATDVNSLDFCDLTDDGIPEIIVCWSVFSKTSGSTISVYSNNTNDSAFQYYEIDKPISSSNFICLDMNDDGVQELLTFTNNSSLESPSASLYSYSDEHRVLLGSTKLDNNINSFESVNCAKTDNGMTVFADAVKSDGSSMVTELIYWSDYYNSIISPFYSYSTGKTTQTTRSNSITCRDIDEDGNIEIPTDENISNLPAELRVQNWMKYGNTVLSHRCYSISSKRDGIIIVIPDKAFKEIKLEYNSNERMISAYTKEDNKKLFDIVTIIKASLDGSKNKYDSYTEVFSNSGFVYLADITPDAEDYGIDKKTLANMIKPY